MRCWGSDSSMAKVAYICGPMTYRKRFNADAFLAAARLLRARGYTVLSPLEFDIARGFDPEGLIGDPKELARFGFTRRDALKQDMAAICGSDIIVCLPGHEHSAGARAEVVLAAAIGDVAFLYLTEADLAEAAGG